MLAVGDKVKFLNARGGGVVARIIDTRMVSVATEGGFEIPTLISELIRIDEKNPAARFFLDKSDTASAKDMAIPPDGNSAEENDERQSTLPALAVSSRKSQDLFLAFSPHDQKWLISGFVDIYLINNTDFDVLYNIFLREPSGRYSGRDYGSCFPGNRLLIGTVTREELPLWSSGYIQFLFHTGVCNEVLPPFNSQFSISGQKFYQEGSYRETPLMEGKCLFLKIVSVSEAIEKRKPRAEKENVASGNLPDDNLIRMHMKGRRDAEVDLHIHELIGDPAEMEGTDALSYQKDYFIRCLESAIKNHVMKLTVIHGVGDGILRENIMEIMKQYEGLTVHDAPMQKYGTGAVEIRIPHNR